LSRLKSLKAAQKISDLVPLLGHKASAIAYLARKLSPSLKYTSFTIPKKSGGIRTIDAPIDRLKQLQRSVADLLYECQGEIEAQRKPKPLPIKRLYSRLLFFKHFVDLQKPLIVAEGKTDSIHLRLAIRGLSSSFPSLASSTLDPKRLGVSFFRTGGLASSLLSLEGGTGHLTAWMANYDIESRVFNKTPDHAVVVLIDSDSGATPILNMMKSKYKKTITAAASAQFHHVCRNLYLVLTPLPPSATSSCIEDFYDAGVLKTQLGGKSFNPTNFDNSPTEYGKFMFAEYVVRPIAKSLNYSGFSPLLNRIDAACADYAQKRFPVAMPAVLSQSSQPVV
jgi:hypothetical protein